MFHYITQRTKEYVDITSQTKPEKNERSKGQKF